MKNGEAVARFEAAFADFVGAEYAIAMANGTCTLHTALAALGVEGRMESPPDYLTTRTKVAVPPLTMSSTALAVLHAGGEPVFVDVDPDTWLMQQMGDVSIDEDFAVPVSLYGLSYPHVHMGVAEVVDAAQTLAPHLALSEFTSYSFQASKILSTGEGGMLVTNDIVLATRARSFSSLGYPMAADQPRIDPAAIKSPDYVRHPTLGYNYRMADGVAQEGRLELRIADELKRTRRVAAGFYREAIAGHNWLTPQKVPEGWTHDYWTFAVAVDTPKRARELAQKVVDMGGERPYAAWRLSYDEPVLAPYKTECPVAEDLQPRLLQFQTNSVRSAMRNAQALLAAIIDMEK